MDAGLITKIVGLPVSTVEAESMRIYNCFIDEKYSSLLHNFALFHKVVLFKATSSQCRPILTIILNPLRSSKSKQKI